MLFFEKLGDVHGFGQRSPKEQIEEKTWIEKFHDWKRGLWRDVRNFFREQFSDRSRAAIRLAQGEARKNVSPATMFAQLPLLNDKQLVARWRQDVPPRYFSERQDVPIDKLDKGAYVVEATDGTLRAYTVLLVTELAVVTKSTPSFGIRVRFAPIEGAGRESLRHFLKFVESTTKGYQKDHGYLAQLKR